MKRNPNTYEMDDKILKARKKLEPRKKRTKPPTNKPSAEIFASSRVWLTPADPDVEETTKERKAKKEYAKEEFADEKLKITWYNRCGKAMQQRMKDYDTVFLFWNGTSRRPYGWLEGPYRALGGVDLGSKFEDRRYCIPMIKRNTKSLPLAQAGFKKVLKLQGDKRPVSKAKENISLRSKLLRGQKRARFISWVKAQRKRK